MTGGDDWTAWLDAHGPALVLFARQWVPGRADAEDVVQEAFLRFWRSRHRAADPAAYLFACVRRCALEWLRGQSRRSRRELASAREEHSDPSLLVGPIEQEERRVAIEAAMGQLPAEQREVVVLKIWGELSIPQIASALEVPVNTAASRYRYALARLRATLSERVTP
ncbi:MAG TPA: sigma-70 family RNA polymerase sigma factor [Gemmataceae bacterium]|nr:sigma-70 family RNA polymerase sigma factor [Gemmataceae bacterium]